MSYTPTTWTTGDTITATALNKIENGIASAGGGVIVATLENGAIEYSFNELWSYANSGYLVYLETPNDADFSRQLLMQLIGDDGGDLYAHFSGTILEQSDPDEPMQVNY